MKTIASFTTRYFLYCALFFGSFTYAADEPFNVGMKLQTPVVITEVNGLSFVDTTTGSNTTVVTAPGDTLAATFIVRGSPNTPVTGSVVESSIVMTTGTGGNNEQITVDNFTLGGGLNKKGVAILRPSGSLQNIRVGASAHVKSNNVAGAYLGTATFRLLY